MKKILFILTLFTLSGCTLFPKCLKSHTELVHHNSWVQFINTGNGVLIPIIHNAHYSDEEICDEYESNPTN